MFCQKDCKCWRLKSIPIQIQLLFQSSMFIAKLSTEVTTSVLLNKIVLEINYRERSFEVNQSLIDISSIF